jgi:hypothetical protein
MKYTVQVDKAVELMREIDYVIDYALVIVLTQG